MDFVWRYGVLFICIAVIIPAAIIWGWMRWWKQGNKRSLISIMSLIGFTLAILSALLAVSTVVYAIAIGGFPYYDPTLLRIYSYGALLSLSGIVFSFAGIWRTSALRWHALICAVGTLIFWFLQASTE
jgi:hypothetical protein